LLFLAPLALWVALLIHPIRTRWWIVRQAMRLIRRRPAPAQPDASAAGPGAPASAPDPADSIWQPTRAPRPLSRRRFLGESALLGGVLGYSMFVEPYALQTVEADLPVAGLPPRFDGLRIAQLSDMHINAYTTADDLMVAVEAINRLQPDVVVLTGDFVDWDARFADDATRPFRELRARDGVFSILGNHDYYSGDIERIKASINYHGLGLLVNQHTLIRRGADTLALIGLDDPRHNRTGSGPRMSAESIDPGRAQAGIPAGIPRVMLVHNPIIVPALIQQYDLDVVLCGHTHGGQFQVPILTDALVGRAEYFVRGRYDLGRSQVYVNRGFGFTGPPIRLRARPEVSLLRLVAA
ncbi:MAG TPA: metallophosphoesterase, partial [Herpetosiphonaceae bacterium]|nr:metallophosphoesterase [Herpetosiphonaceae bacterium]